MRRIVVVFILSLLMAGHFEALADEGSIKAKPNQVTVRLSEYKFEPAQIILKSSEPSELILINEGTVLHEFVTDAIKNMDVDVEINGVVAETNGLAELEIPPKTKAILRFTPKKSGAFFFVCDAKEPKDHSKEGMIGKLIFK
jgi:uncharacterized cupredoxin-like copper-binding protein